MYAQNGATMTDIINEIDLELSTCNDILLEVRETMKHANALVAALEVTGPLTNVQQLQAAARAISTTTEIIALIRL